MKKKFICFVLLSLLSSSICSCDKEKDLIFLKFETVDGKRGGVSYDSISGYNFIEDSFYKTDMMSTSVFALAKRGYIFDHWEMKVGPNDYVILEDFGEIEKERLPHFTDKFFEDFTFADKTYGLSKANPYYFRPIFVENGYSTITFTAGTGIAKIEGCTSYTKYNGEKINNDVCAISENPTSYIFRGWYDNPAGTGYPYSANLKWEMKNFDPGDKKEFFAISELLL